MKSCCSLVPGPQYSSGNHWWDRSPAMFRSNEACWIRPGYKCRKPTSIRQDEFSPPYFYPFLDIFHNMNHISENRQSFHPPIAITTSSALCHWSLTLTKTRQSWKQTVSHHPINPTARGQMLLKAMMLKELFQQTILSSKYLDKEEEWINLQETVTTDRDSDFIVFFQTGSHAGYAVYLQSIQCGVYSVMDSCWHYGVMLYVFFLNQKVLYRLKFTQDELKKSFLLR